MTVRRVRLDGLARDADTFEPVSGLAPLHPRNNTFPGEVFLHLAGDALNWCTAGCAVGDGQYLGRLGYQADQLLDRGLASNVERRFRYDTPAQITAWTRHLAGIEQQLRLMDADPGMLTGGTTPEYLYRRTNGVVGLLERLIEDGCREAIGTGTERLDQALLDNVTLSLPDTRGRAAEAGEIPAIPPRPVPPGGSSARNRKRGRSTVFDDRGPATGTGT